MTDEDCVDEAYALSDALHKIIVNTQAPDTCGFHIALNALAAVSANFIAKAESPDSMFEVFCDAVRATLDGAEGTE